MNLVPLKTVYSVGVQFFNVLIYVFPDNVYVTFKVLHSGSVETHFAESLSLRRWLITD